MIARPLQFALFLLLALAFGTGCTHYVKPGVPLELDQLGPTTATLQIKVAGIQNANAITGQVGLYPQDLEDGIKQSIRYCKAFQVVKEDADYVLSVHINEIDQPLVGLTLNVTTVCEWSLTERGESKPFKRVVHNSQGSATVSDAYLAEHRVQIAAKRSVEKNIEDGLNWVHKEIQARHPQPATAETAPVTSGGS